MKTRILTLGPAPVAVVALVLLAGAGHLAAQAGGVAGTFPAQPFNGLQIDYTIAGGGVGAPRDFEGFTCVREMEGTLDLPSSGAGDGMLSVFGRVRATSGLGASLMVEVCVDNTCSIHKTSGRTDWEAPFNVGVPVSRTAQDATIRIEETGSYNAGSRSLVLVARMRAATPGVGGPGSATSSTTPAPPATTAPPVTLPAPPAQPPTPTTTTAPPVTPPAPPTQPPTPPTTTAPPVIPPVTPIPMEPIPTDLRELILWPLRTELADVGRAEPELDRLAAREVKRLEEWMTLYGDAAAFIEEGRQRVLEKHARIRAADDAYLAAFDQLVQPDGFAVLPTYGPYDGRVNRPDLLASIEAGRVRMNEELDRFKRGEAVVGLPQLGDFSGRSLEEAVAGWRRRIEERKAVIARGEAMVGGAGWFFGSSDRAGLGRMRPDIQRRVKERQDWLAADPRRWTLREVGFTVVADVDREIENTRRTLKELEDAYLRKDLRIGRWGDALTATDVEQRIANWQRENAEFRKSLDAGTFRVWCPDWGGWYSGEVMRQRITEQQNTIAEVNKAVRNETYKVAVFGVAMTDAPTMRATIAGTKDAALRAANQAGLEDLPIAAALHRRIPELTILMFNQWDQAIPKMARPAFVRRDLDIRQATEFLGEFPADLALIRARYERKLAWLQRCREVLAAQGL